MTMKKILFNESYGQTAAVIDGCKTMKREIVPQSVVDYYIYDEDTTMVDAAIHKARYKVGEIVAIAQTYKDAGWDADILQEAYTKKPTIFPDLDECEMSGIIDLPLKYHKGWSNKMFVKADLMPHQIRINDVKVERLQDISDEDCLKEGIFGVPTIYTYYGPLSKESGGQLFWITPREAFASLIDKISGKGTWDKNPFCFCYEFELVK